jgi:Neocarzinostatin family
MAQLDEAIREELHRHSTTEIPRSDIWREVSRRIVHRSRRRTIRTLAAICLSLAALLAVAAVLVVNLSTGTAQRGKHQVLDPQAGPGGFSIDPSMGLTNGQQVTVSIHGLHPKADVWITMCVGKPHTLEAGDNQCNAPAKTFDLNGLGSATVHFAVNRYLSPGGYEVDCATYQGGCSIALVEVNSLVSGDLIANTEAVTFEKSAPATSNPLEISATPDGPYADGQIVTVAGTGYPSNSMVRVGECPSDTDCGQYFHTIQTSPQGTFTAPVVLQRIYTVEQGDAGGGESPVQINCSEPLRCFLMAEEAAPPYSAASSIPLEFNP